MKVEQAAEQLPVLPAAGWARVTIPIVPVVLVLTYVVVFYRILGYLPQKLTFRGRQLQGRCTDRHDNVPLPS